jgi:hypothetical protein
MKNTTTQADDLLTCKELAAMLGRCVRYVYDMRRAGFDMVGGKATVKQALAFLSRNPPPSRLRQSKQKSQQ